MEGFHLSLNMLMGCMDGHIHVHVNVHVCNLIMKVKLKYPQEYSSDLLSFGYGKIYM